MTQQTHLGHTCNPTSNQRLAPLIRVLKAPVSFLISIFVYPEK